MKIIVGRTLSVHNEHELLLKLEDSGLTGLLAQKVIDSKGNELAMRVAEFIQNYRFKKTTSQERAREIMGRNFFGIREAIKYFKIDPTFLQIFTLSEIPFSEAVLQKAKDTHVLVMVFPLSILKIRRRMDSKLFNDQSWYNKEFFAKECGKAGWQLVRKTSVDNSISKNWEEQKALIGEDDEVPTAQVMVYTIIGHYLATGERLFELSFVHTSSMTSNANPVCVGFYKLGGLGINYVWNSNRFNYLGVSSARKI